MCVLRVVKVVVNLGLVYKVQHHSGIIFQFVAFIRKRKRIVPDILAAGGRYDHLVMCAVKPLKVFLENDYMNADV